MRIICEGGRERRPDTTWMAEATSAAVGLPECRPEEKSGPEWAIGRRLGAA